ncbi:MAG: hypothetical protein PHC91_03780 [Eubacteriales bacterium]|nr:hypothetical protein [Eubacteriales bacterium]
MISIDSIRLIEKNAIPEAAKLLTEEDIKQLVEWLSLKDDTIRYQAFQLLQKRSEFAEDVYLYWDIFRKKLKSDNSYQRSIGLMLIAENAKWDTEEKLEETIKEYLELLNDEKPITIRQCVQSIAKIIPFKPELNDYIINNLISLDLMAIKETMRKSVLTDILNVLLEIRIEHQSNEIDNYTMDALSGGILDKKAKRLFQERL